MSVSRALPPCPIKRREERKRKKEKFYIYLDVTHTPGRSQVNPERQEEGKSGYRRRAKGQNSAGGEGNERTSRTNLCGETDLTKTEHTPKPHDTLRRSTGEELGTEWGLVGDRRETTKTINLKRTQFQLQQVSCVTPLWDRSQVAPKGINSCSSSNELRARYVQPHQKTIKGKKKKTHLQACTCLVNIAYCYSSATSKVAQMEKKQFLAVRDGLTLS